MTAQMTALTTEGHNGHNTHNGHGGYQQGFGNFAGFAGFENVANLSALPATGSYVVALPMKIESGSGGPLRIVAFLPKEADR